MCECGADRDVTLGVDIGGTKILTGLVSRTGGVIARHQTPTRTDRILDDTIEACRSLIDGAGQAGHRVAGIGVGAKGAVDRRRGVLLGSLALGHGDIPMKAALEGLFGFPVRVENDVHAATQGEIAFGIGREVDDFLFFNAGTGIMIGIVVGGRLLRGASNTAGENGHVPIDAGRRWPCACGMSGCLETGIIAGRECSPMPPLAGFGSRPDDLAYAYLASSFIDMVQLFDPAAIVLAGGMLNGRNGGARWLIDAVRSAFDDPPRLMDAAAGVDAGLVGAAALPTLPD